MLILSELHEFGGEAQGDFGIALRVAPQLGFEGILRDHADEVGTIGARNITVGGSTRPISRPANDSIQMKRKAPGGRAWARKPASTPHGRRISMLRVST